MGLDMYLSQRHYVKRWGHIAPEHQFEVTVTRGGKPYDPIDGAKVAYVEVEVAYWRKANQVHAWFVRNCQDDRDECQVTSVSREQLIELRDLCAEVLAHPDRANELLPPQSGFFFGSTDVDEYYLDDLRDTVRMLTPVIDRTASLDWPDFVYQSSW